MEEDKEDNKECFDNILKRTMSENIRLELFNDKETDILEKYLKIQKRRTTALMILAIVPVVVMIFISILLVIAAIRG